MDSPWVVQHSSSNRKSPMNYAMCGCKEYKEQAGGARPAGCKQQEMNISWCRQHCDHMK